jgi:hypothetical protein
MTMKRVMALLLLLLPLASVQAQTVLRHPPAEAPGDTRNEYFLSLLSLALEKTASDYGEARLVPADQTLSQRRAVAELHAGNTIDVLWTMTSKAREEQLRPVRIPLLKGLMGYRLLLVRENDLAWFADVHSLAQLRSLQAGQGHDWPDTDILRHNGIRVQTSTDYDSLFTMLRQGRFDFLPRALNEPFNEVAARPDMGLAVEPTLLLYYPAANYFFVAPDNEKLAQRLETGLRRALADGSFDELFRSHPINAAAFSKANILGRRVLRLENPLLPDATPLDDAELWWPPQSPAARRQQRSR